MNILLLLTVNRWIKPGGYIFFRESCFRSSGNIKPDCNPTQYRSLGVSQTVVGKEYETVSFYYYRHIKASLSQLLNQLVMEEVIHLSLW